MAKDILEIRNKTRIPTIATSIQHNTESSSQSNLAINSQFQIGKEAVKLSPCTDDMIIYKEN